MKLENQQEEELLRVIQDEQRKTRKSVNIVDVTRKFHLKILKKKPWR